MYTVVQNLTQLRLPTSLSNEKRRGGTATVIEGKEIFLVLSCFELLTLCIKIMGKREAELVWRKKKFLFDFPIYQPSLQTNREHSVIVNNNLAHSNKLHCSNPHKCF